jgi:hypothetical protein
MTEEPNKPRRLDTLSNVVSAMSGHGQGLRPGPEEGMSGRIGAASVIRVGAGVPNDLVLVAG